MRGWLCILLFTQFFCLNTRSQNNNFISHVFNHRHLAFSDSLPSLKKGDTTYSFCFVQDTASSPDEHCIFQLVDIRRNNCKQTTFIFIKQICVIKTPVQSAAGTPVLQESAIKKTPFLVAHGNIGYSLNYRSYMDTPFAAHDIYQHSLHAYIDVLIKGTYPLRINLSTSFSNEPILRNFTNLNFQFNSAQFANSLKQKLIAWGTEELQKRSKLNAMRELIEEKYERLQSLQQWLKSPVNYQKLVEEREQQYLKEKLRTEALKKINENEKLHNANQFGDSVAENNTLVKTGKAFSNWLSSRRKFPLNSSAIREVSEDSAKAFLVEKEDSNKSYQRFSQTYSEKQKELDSLNKEIQKLEEKYQKEKAALSGKTDSLMQLVNTVKDPAALKQKLLALNLPDSVLPKHYKKLMAIRSFGIGTNPVTYSELSIKNINVTGVQVEYNPKWYTAVASGFISYRFRDYFLNNREQPKQYVTAVRFGKGAVEGNHLFITLYTGKRVVYGYGAGVTENQSEQPRFHVAGYTIESRHQINNNTSVTAEFAKSSYPYYSIASDKNNRFAGLLRVKDHSNEAYSVKLQSFIPSTKTKITANYKRFGNNFQSFSLFTNASVQNAWYIRVSQPLFKKRLTLDASLRKDDFSNPYIAQSYSSHAVFKSIQATLRIRKLPIISVGYYPSSQLIKINDEQFSENLFYTLVGTVTHTYRYRSAMANTSLVYTQFYNEPRDSNFIYYRTRNILLNQSVIYKTMSLQADIALASNTYYSLCTIGSSGEFKALEWLSFGGGVKYNHQTVYNNTVLGYSAKLKIRVKNIGDIAMNYNKGFIPGPNRDLVKNNAGWITYFKTF